MSLNPGRGYCTNGTLENSTHRVLPLSSSAHRGETGETAGAVGSFPGETPHAAPVCSRSPRHPALYSGNDLVLASVLGAIGVIARLVDWLSQGQGLKGATL